MWLRSKTPCVRYQNRFKPWLRWFIRQWLFYWFILWDWYIFSINDENGLFFRPDCSSLCITNSHSHEHPCNKGHKNVLHASLAYSGDFVIFPARTFHWGYYNSNVKKTFNTAQLFAVFKSQYHTHNSWKGTNESLRFYEVQNVLPEKFIGLSNDLLAYWDEHSHLLSFLHQITTRTLKSTLNQTELSPWAWLHAWYALRSGT